MSRWLIDLGPVRESPAFRRLWVGSTLSLIGSALTSFALPLQVYDLTRSTLAVGLLGVAELIPTLIVGWPAARWPTEPTGARWHR
jgi:ENTS family enterobactin (siderophore) exporter